MPEQLVDFADPRIWQIFLVGLAVLAPVASLAVRSWSLAAINLLFLYTLLRPNQFVVVVLSLLVVFAVLQAMVWRGLRLAGLVTLLAGCLTLFLAQRFPHHVTLLLRANLQPLATLLTAVGFSYISLRLIDLVLSLREQRGPVPDLPSTVNYLLPFHMLAAGPIQSYADFTRDRVVRAPLTTHQALEGLERIARGLFKKFVLAFLVQRAFLTGFEMRGWYLLIEAQAFYLWLYLDFSALADIAVGMGRLLGIATPENFNRPLLARNLPDFWERWHISLSAFIRHRIFIPSQLSLLRAARGRFELACAAFALFAAFALCGLWHQGSLRFLLWGSAHALALFVVYLYRRALTARLGRAGLDRYLGNRWFRAASTVLTFEFVAASLALTQV